MPRRSSSMKRSISDVGGASSGSISASEQKQQEQLERPEITGHAPAVNPMSVIGDRIVIAMVGLPARGKSYISRAIVHFFTFLGCPVRLFNAGHKRRTLGLAGADASFFDPSNADAKHQRDQLAMATLDDLLAWLEAVPGCACGIFDATNTTVSRRRAVIERCARAESTTSTRRTSTSSSPVIMSHDES